LYFFFLSFFSGPPTQAPSNIAVRATGETSLSVSWSVIPEQVIQAYNVYFSLADTPDDYQIMKVSSSEGNNVELGDLNIYTLYVIRVSAENAAGEGPKSALVRARTMESGKLIKQKCFC